MCPARDVKPVLELFDIVHLLPFLLDSNGVVVKIVSFGLALSDSYSLKMTLFPMVVVSSGSPPWPSSHVADLPLLQQLS